MNTDEEDRLIAGKYAFIRKVQKKTGGYLYVVTNENMEKDSVFKVGLARKSVEKRLQTMNTSHLVQDRLYLVYSEHFENAPLCERVVHYLLDKYRVSNRREFFKIGRDQIIKTMKWVRAQIDGREAEELITR